MQLVVCGGAGERGRASLLVRWEGGSCLVDCGVQPASESITGDEYPAWDRAALAQLDAVVVTHAHEDRAAGAPLLRALGVTAPIYAHPLVLPELEACARGWLAAARRRGAAPPFDDEHVTAIRALPWSYEAVLPLPGARLRCGPTGHVLGSTWVSVQPNDGPRLLLTGEWTSESVLLPPPAFPSPARAVVIDGAYGAHRASQRSCLTAILDHVAAAIARGGVALVPVPHVGRAQELLLELSAELHASVPLYVEASIVAELERFARHPDQLREGALERLDSFDAARVTLFRGELAGPRGGSVVLATDAGAARGPAHALARSLASGRANAVLFVEEQARGSFGASLLADAARGVGARAEQLVWKTHPDLDEIKEALGRIEGQPTIIVANAAPEPSAWLAELLRDEGHHVVAPAVGDVVDLGPG